MTVELADSLSRKGISSLQQLLDFPKATLQSMIGNFPISRLVQVWSPVKYTFCLSNIYIKVYICILAFTWGGGYFSVVKSKINGLPPHL